MSSCRHNKTVYIPNLIRSHPFRFIFLPLCIVLLFILFWFALYPLIHVFIYKQSIDGSENWFWFYWPLALLLFVLLLIILVFIWRCKSNISAHKECEETECILNNQRKDKELYTTSLSASDKSIELEEIQAEKLFPRCSVKRKPEKIQIEQVVIHEQAKRATLSPRELFFKDLLQQEDDKSNSSIDLNYENRAVFSALNKVTSDTKKNEYFIACVSPTQKNYKNNIFMYINATEEDLKIKKPN